MGTPKETIQQIDRLRSAEPLTSWTIGKQIFRAFDGYDTYQPPSAQLEFLLRNYLVYPTHDGAPLFTLTSPNPEDPILPWENYRPTDFSSTETSYNYSAYSPEFFPGPLNFAPHVITVTNTHHRYLNRTKEERDIIMGRHSNLITPYWYIKGEHPVNPRLMTDILAVSDLLRTRDHELIQLWKLDDPKEVYTLQAGLTLYDISLGDFCRVLTAAPEEL
ncbi:hypothetical protein A2363_04160 [Candidatus Gottesmanbacteria bacterium RIFOXYB1_FULL_47_11]|uniref:Uncharacterized protein n=1 Tax=Candidatus Gottesmanbacteria bacterium RIFOXYB1_FULL_47_11 TaxID=1798401 RepID=A0A1F6BFH0_9BACT|nr:MAG: hypothetical protein A2363_04160 [Candidatus Gottesmanbacteria bacterium RIFOXYB1_FULL_47_11]